MYIKNKYAKYTNERAGTWATQPSQTNQERVEDTEVKNIVEKYGMTALTAKWQAAEPLYIDMTEVPTLNEALEIKQKAYEYFENMPARARKIFGDNADIFYEKYKRGDFEDFIKTGALTEELADHYRLKAKELEERNYEKYRQMEQENNINNQIPSTNDNSNMGTNQNNT